MSQPFDGIETQTGADPRYAIIWLHGLGADGGDFAPIVPELTRPHPDWPALRFVFPHAPIRPVTINNGMRMRAWYDIKGFDIAQRQDEDGVRQSAAFVDGLIAREAERGIAAERVLLAGFSQGGAIALAAGIRHPQRLAGIMALSTYLPLAEKSAAEASPANHALPIFMAHGVQDPVVPLALGRGSADLLAGMDYVLDWKTYPMQHAVCAEEVADIGAWLGARFAS
ncbi:MAG: carboxylesterase [Lysobacteraceae bacterium]